MVKRTVKGLMQAVANGHTNTAISVIFDCSCGTIEKDLQDVYKSLGCKSMSAHTRRAEAVAIAFRMGIIE